MYLCEEHGDTIAYSGGSCPACDDIEVMDKEHSEALVDLEDQLANADQTIADLEDELKEHE